MDNGELTYEIVEKAVDKMKIANEKSNTNGSAIIKFNILKYLAVRAKHGHWIKNIRRFSVMGVDGYVRDEEKVTHTCSVCRIGIVGLDDMNYCLNCGAKMDAEGGAE